MLEGRGRAKEDIIWGIRRRIETKMNGNNV
jgi:hypothetical protein